MLNKFLSVFAAVTMLVGAKPVIADDAEKFSITATKTNWDAGYAFTNADGGGYLVMQMTQDQINNENKPWVSYSIYVEEAGKYTIEFKKEIVKKYLNGEGSSLALGKEFGINDTLIRRWTKKYTTFGENAFDNNNFPV